MESGLDSLGSVELRNQLQQAVGEGTVLPSTLTFDHPTARSLAILTGADTVSEPVYSARTAPILGQALARGMSTVPNIDELRRMHKQQLSSVSNFTVVHPECG